MCEEQTTRKRSPQQFPSLKLPGSDRRSGLRQERLAIIVRGIVQGVGFRPYISHLARNHQVTGSVRNTVRGVRIEIEGTAQSVHAFRRELLETGEYRSFIHESDVQNEAIRGSDRFRIEESSADGLRSAWITPDLALCEDCRNELLNPDDRRYRYPFISCARCGPRYSILNQLPFDRETTVMKNFPLCPECHEEYADPDDRRHHAQTMTCPVCGPHIEACDSYSHVMERDEAALEIAVNAIRDGRIVALQGIGGFQLLADARNGEAVAELRIRKWRPDKPFAVMYPGIDEARNDVLLSELEEELLLGPESPIVLVPRRPGTIGVVREVAPRNPNLGVMIPYSPLHELLLRDFGGPVIATSGNLSGEAICIERREAFRRLDGVADIYLVHNRPILRPVDDSVVRVIAGRPVTIRSARGYAPVTIPVGGAEEYVIMAFGSQMKNTIALRAGGNLILSQHVGDLDALESRKLHYRTAEDLRRVYQVNPEIAASDQHPDYSSSLTAKESESALHTVQHHHAHVVSCMLENGLFGEVFGLSWDGTGMGSDGTIWGGEGLCATRGSFTRIATFRSFPIPGGDAAIREPKRSALGILYTHLGEALLDNPFLKEFVGEDWRVIEAMLNYDVNAPNTSAVGRLFDGVASLLGIRDNVTFEGQAAMELEFAATNVALSKVEAYPIPLYPRTGYSGPDDHQDLHVADWGPAIDALISGIARGEETALMAACWHKTLAAAAVAMAEVAGRRDVVLTGGCFQNRILSEMVEADLRDSSFHVWTHRRIPPNDGGLAAGQAWAVAATVDDERKYSVSRYPG